MKLYLLIFLVIVFLILLEMALFGTIPYPTFVIEELGVPLIDRVLAGLLCAGIVVAVILFLREDYSDD